jgi:hypothetical protein
VNAAEVNMRADRVEISWDTNKSKWMVRIQSGDEVIRRQCQLGKNADEQQLRTMAQQTVKDEGYEADPAQIQVQR